MFGKDDRLAFIREKPETPPSPYAVIGIYMYDPEVFSIVRELKPSGRGELEITDVNNAYIDRGAMEYDVIDGFWGDAGESIDVYYQVIDWVRAHGANRRAAPRRSGGRVVQADLRRQPRQLAAGRRRPALLVRAGRHLRRRGVPRRDR